MAVPSVSDVLSIPTRWGGVSNAANGIAQYLAQQQQRKQELQYNLANQLINAQALSMAYGGQQNPTIASMLDQNPYGKGLFPSVQAQGNGGTPSSMPSAINANGMFGLGGNLGFGSMTPAPGGSGTTPMMGGQFNPLNSVGQSDNVATSASMEYKPFVGMVPSKVDIQNVPAQARIAGAKSYAEKSAAAQQGAQETESRDIQQLAMVKNAIKPLVDSYEDVYNKGFAGDIYGSGLAKNADFLPQNFLGMNIQKSFVPPEVQKSTGQFLANKNELVTKLQPLLSQQFGKEGSARIMESLINMSKQEIGDLNTPRDQFHGQITGTLSSLYRIAKASQAYSKDLAQSGQTNPDPDVAAQAIAQRMSMQNLSPKEQKELQGMIDDVLGKKELPKTSDFNPVSKANGVPSYDPKTQKLQRNKRTGEYRVVGI